jgi:dipeptidyl aminopeptidase/acylaminoacyl peptidase
MRLTTLIILVLLLLPGTVVGQEAVTVWLEPVGESGVSATATLIAVGDGTRVTLEITGLVAGADARASLHAGACEMPSASFTPLPDLKADTTGRASATGPALFRGTEAIPLATMADGERIITIQVGRQLVACGVIPRLATSPAPATLPETGGAPAYHGAQAQQGGAQAVAYIQGGDLWMKELATGETRQLSTGGNSTTPRWSPSGQWLAYLAGDQLGVVHRSGEGARPVEKDHPVVQFAWSPTSDTLAYSSRSGELWVASVPDWAARRIVSNPAGADGGGVRGLAWSPDGEWIAYEWQEGRTYQGLWKIPAGGGEPIELYDSDFPEKGEAIIAGWSGDARFIVFWQGDIVSASLLADGAPLYAVPAGGGTRAVLAETALVYSDFVAVQPAGGERVAVVAGGYRGAWTNKTLYVVQPATGEKESLSSPGQVASSPAWSPDGQHVAFVAMPDEGDLVGGEEARLGMQQRRIWMGTAGSDSQPQQLTDDDAYRDEYPLWSADGSHILFVRINEQDQTSLWLLSPGEGTARPAVDEVGPLPGPAPGWWGYYGHVAWDDLFDWWPGATPAVLPVSGETKAATVVLIVAGALALAVGWRLRSR